MKPPKTYWTKKKLGGKNEQCFDTMIASSTGLHNKILILNYKYQNQGNEDTQAVTASKPGHYLAHGKKVQEMQESLHGLVSTYRPCTM